ncbi:hypothetical protein AVDCRST_MAG82-3520 [uncultured Rubrobacteraceae bacterium]|uniref:Uncharacterized protein n=1 Tax=uncultured Rubrobacteraceae bacterium TaxID=349277 RepID=A0A6J4QVY8_9ACTN|nr:hypothetical protein AVDCRST_MAG82-3520 [uncultured Rubrobacteraceae bacterium]
MSPMQIEPDPTPWTSLGESLAGSFAARARGPLASDFALLDRRGGEIGRLKVNGSEGAGFGAGDLQARIERVTQNRYEMISGGAEEVLTSTGDTSTPEITCLGHPYEARLSLLRNKAEAGPPGGEVAVRITGGLTNRRYDVSFEAGTVSPLPVALFLLYRIVALRREAYRA